MGPGRLEQGGQADQTVWAGVGAESRESGPEQTAWGTSPSVVSSHLVGTVFAPLVHMSTLPELTGPRSQRGPYPPPGQPLLLLLCTPQQNTGSSQITSLTLCPRRHQTLDQGQLSNPPHYHLGDSGQRPHQAFNTPGWAKGDWVLPDSKLDHRVLMGIMKHLSTLSTQSAPPHEPGPLASSRVAWLSGPSPTGALDDCGNSSSLPRMP